MAKIMLVEDDKSLREIYGVRLLAEGYDIVSAGDGEEALAMAIKERPDLIVSDVMMPKISGFDMLDILRSTTETRNIKVIMMTALSSEDQRLRGESLGADRYLVKSQVGIEDVVRVVHEVLQDAPAVTTAAVPAPPAPNPVRAMPPPLPTPTPVAPRPAPAVPAPAVRPTFPTPAPSIPVAAPAPAIPVPAFAPRPAVPPTPTALPTNTPKPPSLRTRTIEPLNDPSISPVDINDLLDKELAKEAGVTANGDPNPQTVDQERAIINKQLEQTTLASTPTSEDDIPSITVSENGTVTPEAHTQLPQPNTNSVPPRPPTPPLPPAPTPPPAF
jgi:CheY-like chemotaxis protein